MNRAILICMAALSLPLLGNKTAPATHQTETYVYICTGPYADKYHSKSNCKGLRNCSADIKRVTQSYAEKKGRKKCKLCYKKQNSM